MVYFYFIRVGANHLYFYYRCVRESSLEFFVTDIYYQQLLFCATIIIIIARQRTSWSVCAPQNYMFFNVIIIIRVLLSCQKGRTLFLYLINSNTYHCLIKLYPLLGHKGSATLIYYNIYISLYTSQTVFCYNFVQLSYVLVSF